MDPGLVLLANLVTVIVFLAVALRGRRIGWLAPLPLVDATLLAVYVFSEDTYRGDISRWNAYRSPGGLLGTMFVLSIVLLVGCAALLIYAATRRIDGLFRGTALACGGAGIFLVLPTIIGFTAN